MAKSNFQPGEGNREADQHYREKAREFVKKGNVEQAAKNAGKQDPKEAERAELAGKKRAKEVDPEVHREYKKPVKNQ